MPPFTPPCTARSNDSPRRSTANGHTAASCPPRPNATAPCHRSSLLEPLPTAPPEAKPPSPAFTKTASRTPRRTPCPPKRGKSSDSTDSVLLAPRRRGRDVKGQVAPYECLYRQNANTTDHRKAENDGQIVHGSSRKPGVTGQSKDETGSRHGEPDEHVASSRPDSCSRRPPCRRREIATRSDPRQRRPASRRPSREQHRWHNAAGDDVGDPVSRRPEPGGVARASRDRPVQRVTDDPGEHQRRPAQRAPSLPPQDRGDPRREIAARHRVGEHKLKGESSCHEHARPGRMTGRGR
jgi:hypothetical protein